MKKYLSLTLFTVWATCIFAQSELPTYNADDINIAYRKYTLPNGLRLIVHEDHKAPIAAVNIWYHVGSKNERMGKSGFAHLFEHLMFNGSEHYNNDYFQALEAIGASDLNGTTNEDRTNYFQNVPIAALDQLLFLESDRMGHLLGAIDQAKLDEQRGVVQNEKRQGENQPYAREYEMMQKEMYPPHHPYGHTVIGEMEDLNAAKLEDVHAWFKQYYGAANAVIVVTGDVNTDEIYEKVLKNFGNIPAGPTLSRYERNIPKRFGETRMSYQDRVPEAKVEIVWNVPQWGTEDVVWLDLVSDVLSAGKNSRLFKKLVYEKQLASNAYAYCSPSEISGNFNIGATIKSGHTVAEVEAAINEVLNDLLANGPTEEEVKRVKAAYFANFIKGLERIGGFGGKSDLLAINEVFGGSPDFYKTSLKRYQAATAKNLHDAAKKWLSDGRLVVECTPFPEYTTSGTDIDRSKVPEVAKNVAAQFPTVERATLKNGMKVVLARRTESPTVVMSMLFDAGFVTDKFGGKLGLGALAMNMLDEGTTTKTALQINERLQLLGASVGTFSDLDYSYVNLNTLKQSLDQSLDLYADVVQNPAFSENDLNRIKEEQISEIESEMTEPFSMAMRVAPLYLYGENHPYAMPMSGNGNVDEVKNISLDDVRNFHKRWICPNNATITVVGDITMDELKAKLEKRFSKWGKCDVPKKVIPEVVTSQKGKMFLIDRPESQQSVILAGYLTKKYGELDENAIEQMNNVLGGDFTSRINLNIREDKHWSYGAGSFISESRGQRPYIMYAPVQTDKTKESAMEMIKEVNAFVTDKPMTQQEFDKTKQNTVLGTAGMWETNGRVNRSLQQLVKYNLNDNYWNQYGQKVQNLTLKEVQNTAKTMIQPNELGWFVTGDKAKVLPGLQQMGLEIIEIDANGKPVTKKVKP